MFKKNLILLFIFFSFFDCFSNETTFNLYFDNLNPRYQKTFYNQFSSLIVKNGQIVDSSSPYVISANFNIISEEVSSSIPIVYMVNIEISIVFGDVVNGKKLNSFTKIVKGAGKNLDTSIMSAVKNFLRDRKTINDFILKSSDNIISYYNQNCFSITKKVNGLVGSKNFDEAIKVWSFVPVKTECYQKNQNLSSIILNQKLLYECNNRIVKSKILLQEKKFLESKKNLLLISKDSQCYGQSTSLLSEIEGVHCSDFLSKAKAEYGKQNFLKSLDLLSSISINMKCFDEASNLIEKISTQIDNIKIQEAEQRRKKIERDFEIQKLEKEVMLEIAKNTKFEYNYDVISLWY